MEMRREVRRLCKRPAFLSQTCPGHTCCITVKLGGRRFTGHMSPDRRGTQGASADLSMAQVPVTSHIGTIIILQRVDAI